MHLDCFFAMKFSENSVNLLHQKYIFDHIQIKISKLTNSIVLYIR